LRFTFDKTVAETFPSHARSHIPNYDSVIDQTVNICRLKGAAASVIDVGAATGETIGRLHQAGFRNLTGVDSSQDMLDKCPAGFAKYIKSNTFPEGRYDVVVLNWTLHFIENKRAYLNSVFPCLNPGGILILSEKTSNDEFPRTFYYDFKRSQGVSEADILRKEESLKSIMFINDVPWYFKTLNEVGFSKIFISDAFWCFTTFVCLKA
jgi:SAM-dependent methyltransferase